MKSLTATFILGALALLAGLLGACSDSGDEAVAPNGDLSAAQGADQDGTQDGTQDGQNDQPDSSGDQTGQIQARPQVMSTIDIWANVVADSTCGQVDVDSVIPSGADPHHYEPVPQDVLALEDADMVVVNGLNLEESLLDNLVGVGRMFTIADLVSVDDEQEAHDDEHDDDHADEGDHDHDHGGTDPHLWFDLHIVEEAVEHIIEELTPLVADPHALRQCADSYLSQLEDAEDYVSQQLLSVPADNRILVTQHLTLERLADRFGYEILGSIIPSTSTLADADIRSLIELQQDIEAAGVRAIFVDVSGDNSDVRNFADQSGVPVVVLYTETLSAPGGEADSYLKMMRLNAERIAAALG